MTSDQLSPPPSGDQDEASEEIRTRAEQVGAQLSQSFSELVGLLPGAPLGPRLLSEQLALTVGTASRFLRAIAETVPIDALQNIPGPAPLRRALKAAKKARLPAESIQRASGAVTEFEGLIRQLGGNRTSLSTVLAAWQPKGRKQFVLRRRQAAHRALAELKGVSTELQSTCYVFHPSANSALLDLLILEGFLGIARSRPDANFYVGSRRQSAGDGREEGQPQFLTLDGQPATDDLQSIRLEGFSTGASAPISSTQVGEEVIHSLAPTGIGAKSRVDLVVAKLIRSASRRRGPSHCTDPLSIFTIPAAPTRRLCLDLLIHDDVLPQGKAERMVYSIIPRGPVKVGDPARANDIEQIPESLEIGSGGLDALHLEGSPRYLPALRHCFQKLGWDPDRFSSWRLEIAFPPPGDQFCIILGRESATQG